MQKKKNKYSDGWIPLMGDLLREMMGNKKRFLKMRDALETDGLIFIDHSYSREGKTSKRYKLVPALTEGKWHYVEASGNLTERLIQEDEKDMLPVDHELKKMLQYVRLPYDEIAESQDYNMRSSFKTVNFTYWKLYCLSSPEQFYAYVNSYHRVKNRVDTYKLSQYGRRHNFITNMPKILRNEMYAEIEGKRINLNQIDIKNSQVLLLLTILKGKTEAEDYYTFKDDVESGEFYERLASALKNKFGDVANDEADRSRFKEAFFEKYLYGDNKERYVYSSSIYKAFKKRYPNVHAIIEEYKNKNGYAALAQKMQKIEATIIVKEVCSRLLMFKRTRARFVAQVYDSIIISEEDAHKAIAAIKEAFLKRGINVMLTVK